MAIGQEREKELENMMRSLTENIHTEVEEGGTETEKRNEGV